MPCPGRNAPSPPRLTPLRHPHLSHTITTTPSHHQHLPPLVPLPVLILRLRPPRFISFYSAKNIQKSFRMMVHDDLLTRHLPSASRRDATPFLRRPPPPSRYLRGYIPRKRFNPLPPLSPLSGIEQHVCSNFFDIPFSFFFFLVLFFFFFSFFTLLFGGFQVGEETENHRRTREISGKIIEYIVLSRFSLLSLSLSPVCIFSFPWSSSSSIPAPSTQKLFLRPSPTFCFLISS